MKQHRQTAIALPLPREHGAYVILACAWLLGLVQAPAVAPLFAVLALVAVTMAFFVQEPIRQLLLIYRTGRNSSNRFRLIAWSATMTAVGLGTGVPIVLHRPAVLWLLLPAALVAGLYTLLVYRRTPMEKLALAGFAGLTLAGPTVRLAVADGFHPGELLGLWLLTALFFCGSSYCVGIRLKGTQAVAPAVGYHLLAIILIAGLTLAGLLPWVALAAMLPAAGRLLWIITDVERYRMLPLKRIGIHESVYSLLFVGIYALQ